MGSGTAPRVVVTGAGRGAGWGIAVVFAETGAEIAALDIDRAAAEKTASEISRRGGKGVAIECDVANEKQVQTAFKLVEDEFGALDVLVNTVAYIDPPARVVDMPFDTWRKAISVNMDSVFLCSRAAIPLLAKSDAALILNISSINGTRGFPYRAPYGASKAAIINLTETLAMELGDEAIRVNCLVPGGITGERIKMLGQWYVDAGIIEKPSEDGDNVGELTKGTTLLTPEQVGRYALFLASSDGAPINGQALWIGAAARSGAQVLF